MKHLYIVAITLLLSISTLSAQSKSNFLDRVKGVFSTEVKIGTYTFKDGSLYTGDLKRRKPHGMGKTVFKNGDTYEGEYFKGLRQIGRAHV